MDILIVKAKARRNVRHGLDFVYVPIIADLLGLCIYGSRGN